MQEYKTFSFKKMREVVLFLCILLGVNSYQASAQSLEKSYQYSHITYVFEVKTDTTVLVTETQKYAFQGEYHQGYRSIPLKGVDAIDAISMVDEDTKTPLVYSPKRLTKTDSTSWGKYTTYRENNAIVIEWYYDARDTTRSWTLHYTLHGALGFFDTQDELYWNLFTDYTVPVREVEAIVVLPKDSARIDMPAIWYVAPPLGERQIQYLDTHTVVFSGRDFPSQTKATIAISWPRGSVDRSLYWREWILRYIWILGAVVIVFVSLISILVRYILTERWHTGRGTIIPEYEPPHHLPPAMAEVIVTENVSNKAWSATIVDLAVRGFLRIEEIPKLQPKYFVVLVLVMAVSVVCGIRLIFGGGGFTLVVVTMFALWLTSTFRKGGLIPTHYRIIRNCSISMTSLEKYEADFLALLFPDGKTEFSTKDILSMEHKAERDQLQSGLIQLRRTLLNDTATETHAYAVDFLIWDKVKTGLVGVCIVGILIFMAIGRLIPLISIPILIALYFVILAVLFFRYNPRLSKEGQVFREEWLGFKLYLETAEKGRLQNLKPDLFEKYLPYAIIFGVEKEWGNAFRGISMNQPEWYGSGLGASSGSTFSSTSGFSAATFSASFASSFAVAFSSAGGGSASSGGGSAGGGGGGGGGGAS